MGTMRSVTRTLNHRMGTMRSVTRTLNHMMTPQSVRDEVREFCDYLGLHRPPLRLEYASDLSLAWLKRLEDIPDLYKGTDTVGAVASFDGIPMAAHADLRPGTWRLVHEPPGGDDG